jgi:hypothetical protein
MPDIESYDRKRIIDRLRFVTYATNVYKAANCGYVGRTFVNGVDLGAAQATIGAVDANGEWIYDSATDALYICNTGTNLTSAGDVQVASDTWANIKTEAINRASERLRGYVGKPILARPAGFRGSETLRTYEDIIILCASIYACALLVAPHDPALARMLEQRVFRSAPATDEEPGYADQIKSGHVRLWNENTAAFQQGIPRAVSVNTSTTGGIDELRGRALVDFDLIKVKITTAGTFSYGSASTVKYSVYIGDSTGLKTSLVVDAQTITGGWQPLAHGLDIRFATGVYTLNDEWEVEVRGDPVESGSRLGNISITRV